MRILVLGSGLMGPAAAFNTMADPDVSLVAVCDLSQRQLDACVSKLADLRGAEKLSTVLIDVGDQAAAVALMSRWRGLRHFEQQGFSMQSIS